MSPRCLLPGELQQRVEIDHRREMALIAVAGCGAQQREIGVARYVREDTGVHAQEDLAAIAEFAVVVTDDWQRRGIGELLLRRLRNAADESGVVELAGITLATNTGMLRLARRLGLEVSPEAGDWTVRRIRWCHSPAVRRNGCGGQHQQ